MVQYLGPTTKHLYIIRALKLVWNNLLLRDLKFGTVLRFVLGLKGAQRQTFEDAYFKHA